MAPTELASTAAFALFAVSYLAFWFFTESDRIKASFTARFGQAESLVRMGPARFVFALAAGLVPILALPGLSGRPLRDFGLAGARTGVAVAAIAAVAAASFAVCFALSFFSRKSPADLEFYPQIKAERWTPGVFAVEILGWGVYLFAYESAFRGYLPATLMHSGLAFWPTVAVMTSLYVALHIPKGFKEAALAAPFGVALSLASLWSGNIWIAFFAHLGLATGNDFGALRTARGTKPHKSGGAGSYATHDTSKRR